MTDHATLLRQISREQQIGTQINAIAEAEFLRLKAAGYPPKPRYSYERDPKRVPGPHYRPAASVKCGIPPEDADAAFRAVLVALDIATIIGWEERCEARSLALAGRIAGLWGNSMRHAAADMRACGYAAAAKAWAPYMRPADPKCIGYVYAARADEHPSIVKIGFSTRVDERLKELASQVCSPVRLITSIPATQLHEYTIHQCLGRRRIGSEWYPRSVVPSWLLQPVLRVVA